MLSDAAVVARRGRNIAGIGEEAITAMMAMAHRCNNVY